MKFICAILLMAFVGATEIDLCNKNSDCKSYETSTGNTYYCASMTADSDGSSFTLKTCIESKYCGDT